MGSRSEFRRAVVSAIVKGRGIRYMFVRMSKFRSWFPIVFAVFFVGCATTKIDWNSRIGSYTFDEAVSELGVPERQATLSDGSVVAEWLTGRGGAYGHTHYSPGWRFQTYDIYEMPDQYLRLVFGPDKTLARAGNFSR